jgi:hypothetical protein
LLRAGFDGLFGERQFENENEVVLFAPPVGCYFSAWCNARKSAASADEITLHAVLTDAEGFKAKSSPT